MNIKKIVINILIILLINVILLPNSYVLASDIIESGSDFLEKGGDINDVINQEVLKNTSNYTFKVLLSIGICITVIVGAILGFQFILGSAEGKAKVSEALIPYIIGCFIIFGAFTIWSIVINIGNSIS